MTKNDPVPGSAADQQTAAQQAANQQAVLGEAARLALEYVASVGERRVVPDDAAIAALAAFDEPLPAGPSDPTETLRLLDEVGGPATVASSGSDYYGFVTGAAHPAALGAAWLASAWDQNAALPVMSPVVAHLHRVVEGWLVDLLGLPVRTEVAFVTGATMANAAALVTARDTLLSGEGWDAQSRGLLGAPEVAVVVGEHVHTTLRKALGTVGLGRERAIVVPTDSEGRMRADALAEVLADVEVPVIVCAQAGEVNTGAFDPFDEIADLLVDRTAWLHVDGAFGLWALADPSRSALVRGLDRADSWATDGHKWLNVTYDSGLVLVREPGALRRSFFASADYLPPDPDGAIEAMHRTPQTSQRARVLEVWAVLRSLGRDGVARLVAESSGHARLVADRLRAGGLEVLNDVVLNQVLVRAQDATTTTALLAAVHADGRMWCGPTVWDGQPAMRISVSSWRTSAEDAARAADVVLELAARLQAR